MFIREDPIGHKKKKVLGQFLKENLRQMKIPWTLQKREVEEETGVQNTKLISLYTTTYHVYDEYGKHILKESHWFHMSSPGEQKLIPQEEEQITAIEWTDAKRRKQLLPESYPMVKELLSSL